MQAYTSPGRQQGFTLVEILIASTILFMVLASATLSYRTLVHSEQQASEVVELHSVLPILYATLQNNIREQNELASSMNGSGELMRWNYDWVATRNRVVAPAERFDPNLSEFTEYEPRYAVYDIELRISLRDGARAGKQRQFNYQELIWKTAPAVPVASR
ncbi:prepilin-type N-terminal cleavage/methylation domain-containing protein [Idiomarina seosinensis]|uniref:PulJ/GspJ family protein n=1 Tax=Idiomarina seosinensis TaxID=281739 RepID=UPI00384A5BB0